MLVFFLILPFIPPEFTPSILGLLTGLRSDRQDRSIGPFQQKPPLTPLFATPAGSTFCWLFGLSPSSSAPSMFVGPFALSFSWCLDGARWPVRRSIRPRVCVGYRGLVGYICPLFSVAPRTADAPCVLFPELRALAFGLLGGAGEAYLLEVRLDEQGWRPCHLFLPLWIDQSVPDAAVGPPALIEGQGHSCGSPSIAEPSWDARGWGGVESPKAQAAGSSFTRLQSRRDTFVPDKQMADRPWIGGRPRCRRSVAVRDRSPRG